MSIKSVENEEATLASGGTSFSLPQRMLPKDMAVGDEVVVTISSIERHQNQRRERAHELLNEILKNA